MFEPPVQYPVISRITRRQDPVVTRFRDSAVRQPESSHDDVVLDGIHLVRDALHAGVAVDTVLATAPLLHSDAEELITLWQRIGAAGCDVYEVTTAVMAAASPVKTPTGIVALAQWTPVPLAQIWETPSPFVIGLVDVQDPGNAGAAIRSADGLGATGVVMVGATADPSGARTLRGAMGSTFRLPIARASLTDTLQGARAAHLRIAATLSSNQATTELRTVDLTGPTLLLLGNEGRGLPAEAVDAAHVCVSVAMRPGVNSFNVAVTAAVILYEARTQRSGT